MAALQRLNKQRERGTRCGSTRPVPVAGQIIGNVRRCEQDRRIRQARRAADGVTSDLAPVISCGPARVVPPAAYGGSMLTHGREELEALASVSDVNDLGKSNGWLIDLWEMTGEGVDGAIKSYRALLLGGATDPVVQLLQREGIDLPRLLLAEEATASKITRADLTELTAAASMIAADGCDTARMHMPNVPKMSRKKSDSGVDIFDVSLGGADPNDLTSQDHLVLASVKHTVQSSAGSLRWGLVNSLTKELSHPYLTAQLRVLAGRLQQEGMHEASSARVFMFLRGFPDSDAVDLFAIGVVAPDVEDSLREQIALLPQVHGPGKRKFRMIVLPGLKTIHQRCP